MKARYLIAISLTALTIAGVFGLKVMKTRAQTKLVPYTATLSETFYPAGATTPTSVATATFAVRSDGASVRINHNTLPDGTRQDVRRLFLPDHSVVVEPTTGSIIVSKAPSHLMTVPPGECAGKSDGQILGHPVNLAIQNQLRSDGNRQDKKWLATDVNCLALVQETIWGTGAIYKVVVTNLVIGEPEPTLFKVPDSYVERSQQEVFAELNRLFPGLNLKEQ